MCDNCKDFSDRKLENVLERMGQGKTNLGDMEWMTEFITYLRQNGCKCKNEDDFFMVSQQVCKDGYDGYKISSK